MTRLTFTVFLCWVLASITSEAQTIPGCNSLQFTIEQIGENHVRLTGEVEIECPDGKYYADVVDLFTDTNELVASGNVVFTFGQNRIAADRVEFNIQTLNGTFYDAFGTAYIGGRVDRSMFGSQDPEAYFWGDMIEKLGPRKYRITNGGFTTCTQPTPRWHMFSTTMIVNLDDYVVLRNVVLKVKDVPLFYLPALYYPIQEDNRATGFLLPTWGTSTSRGQSISNAFFWAINRSHDATIMYDWFSKTGQGVGAEYRYNLASDADGSVRSYFLNERETIITKSSNGEVSEEIIPGRRSYQIEGGATQKLGGSFVARGQVDYFSDVTVQQTFHTQILEASRRNRRYGANVAGTFGTYTLNGTFDWNETFFGDTQSTRHGTAPRISFSREEQPIGNLPIYFSFASEYAGLLRQRRSGDKAQDAGLTRIHMSPTVRLPFTSWRFLTINSTVGWGGTYWTQSLDKETGKRVKESITRRYFNLQSQITGPVFVRIWDTPGNSYAERFKHVIEPVVTLQRVTGIDNFDQIVQLEGTDSVVGSVTKIGYGLNNRFYARRAEGIREIFNIAIKQSYYTDARAAQFDRQFRTSFNRTTPSNFSPVAFEARVSPTSGIKATFRADYDTQFRAIRTMGADGTIEVNGWLQASGGWSQRRFIEKLQGFNNPNSLDHYVNASASVRTPGNEFGGHYSLNYDVMRGSLIQQRILGYYNAQCCGISAEFQSFDFTRLGSRARVPEDLRFNISFTLAGLGTFSNFFGALLGGFPGDEYE